MTIWTVPQLFGDSKHGYSYRIRFGISKDYYLNAPIVQYIDLKAIERTKAEARVFLQVEGKPWVLLSGFDLGMSDVILGLAAVKRLLLFREGLDRW